MWIQNINGNSRPASGPYMFPQAPLAGDTLKVASDPKAYELVE
jgi:hypothetical protein